MNRKGMRLGVLVAVVASGGAFLLVQRHEAPRAPSIPLEATPATKPNVAGEPSAELKPAAVTTSAGASARTPSTSGYSVLARLCYEPGFEAASGIDIVLAMRSSDESDATEVGRATSGPDGVVRFSGLDLGSYSLDLAPAEANLGLQTATVGFHPHSPREKDIGFFAIFKAARIIATVRGPDGKRVRDARIIVEPEVIRSEARSAMTYWGSGHAQRSDAEGLIILNGIPPGRHALRARHPEFCESASVRVELREGETANAVALSLKPAGAVTVRVTDEQGAVVSQAKVSLETIDRGIGGWRHDDDSWITDRLGDGSLRIHPVPEGAFILRVTSDRHPPTTVNDLNVSGSETVHRDVVLGRGLEITGIVVDRDGRPVPGAHVWFNANIADTDSDGHFRLACPWAGSHALEVYHERFEPASLGDVAAGTRDLRIELAPGSFVAGRLVPAGGHIDPKARIRIDVDGDAESSYRAWEPLEGKPDGSFVVPVTPGMPHTIRFVGRGFAPVTIGPYTFSPGEAIEGVEVPIGPGVTLQGRVVIGSDQRPVPFLPIRVHVPEEGDSDDASLFEPWGRFDGMETQTAVDGTFRITDISADPQAPLRLSIPPSGYPPFKRIVTPEERAEPLLIRLSYGGTLEGSAPRPGDEGYHVFVKRDADDSTSDGPLQAGVCSVSAAGTYRVTGLLPGRYGAELRKGARAYDSSSVETRSFQISGEETVTIDFDETKALRVCVRGRLLREGEGVEGYRLSLAGAESVFATSRENGAFTLGPVPPGIQTISIGKGRHAGYGFSKSIEVPDADEVTRIIEFPSAALELTVRAADDGKALSGAWVSVGLEGRKPGCFSKGLTNANGLYFARHLEPGSYTVTVGLSGRLRLTQRLTVDVKDGESNACEVLLPLRGIGSIRGTLRLSEGEPPDAATVWLHSEEGQGSVLATLSKEGSYRAGPIPEGEYTLAVVVPGFAAERRTSVIVHADKETVEDFALARGGSLRVRVRKANGEAARSWWVRLSPASLEPGSLLETDQEHGETLETDRDGQAYFTDRRPGDYRVRVEHNRRVIEGRATVRPGETVEITLTEATR